jgi:hypothetical protein
MFDEGITACENLADLRNKVHENVKHLSHLVNSC